MRSIWTKGLALALGLAVGSASAQAPGVSLGRPVASIGRPVATAPAATLSRPVAASPGGGIEQASFSEGSQKPNAGQGQGSAPTSGAMKNPGGQRGTELDRIEGGDA